MKNLGLIGLLMFASLFLVAGVVERTPGKYIASSSDSIYILEHLKKSEINRLDSVNVIYDPCGIMNNIKTQLICSDKQRFVITHIGDSHIASESFTSHFRTLIQRAFGSAGRGLVLPLCNVVDCSVESLQKWTSAKLTTESKDLHAGVSGYAFETQSTIVKFAVSGSEYFDKIRVFCHPEAPRLSADDSLMSEICCPDEDSSCVTVVFRSALNNVDLIGQTQSVFQRPVYYAMSLENGNKGVLYHAIGVVGAAMEHYNNNKIAIEGTKNLAANLTIVSLGTNESFGTNFSHDYFRNQILKLVSLLRQANPETVIMFTTPMENGRKIRGRYIVNKNARIAAQTLKECALEGEYAVWDWYEISGGAGSMNRWCKANLMSHDRIHLTNAGYKVQAEMLFSVLTRN